MRWTNSKHWGGGLCPLHPPKYMFLPSWMMVVELLTVYVSSMCVTVCAGCCVQLCGGPPAGRAAALLLRGRQHPGRLCPRQPPQRLAPPAGWPCEWHVWTDSLTALQSRFSLMPFSPVRKMNSHFWTCFSPIHFSEPEAQQMEDPTLLESSVWEWHPSSVVLIHARLAFCLFLAHN